MSIETVQLFLALLAVLAAAGTVVILGVAVVRRRDLLEQLRSSALALAWAVATTSTAGSLYLSEVAGYEPCRLCWYQRFAMYPMVLILGYAIYRRSRSAAWTSMVLSGIGIGIAGYHVALQRIPDIGDGSCSVDVPCTGIYVEELGFITIPTMALVGFVTIGVLLAVWLRPEVEVAT